ncbi:MAG: DUF1192 domain-containing protein [Hyphomicrobiales bacterium]|nr:DUF1192 domain-containing protein [Hyphomicrobiales bacterium]
MALFDDDDRPSKPVTHEVGQDLSQLSVDELQARADLLRAEIVRIEAESEKKQASKSAADSIFRS